MARGRHQQCIPNQLRPHEEYEDEEARRHARCDRGDDSDTSTVGNENECSHHRGDNVEDNDQGNLNDLEKENLLETTVRKFTISVFKRVLMFMLVLSGRASFGYSTLASEEKASGK